MPAIRTLGPPGTHTKVCAIDRSPFRCVASTYTSTLRDRAQPPHDDYAKLPRSEASLAESRSRCDDVRTRSAPVAPHADRYVISSGPNTVTSRDRKSTRLNSSHSQISYAVFCL